MKAIKKLKLTRLSLDELEKREMDMLIGGNASASCGCGCNGTSSTASNASSNSSYGYSQSYGGNKVCVTWYDKNNDGIFQSDEYTESAHF